MVVFDPPMPQPTTLVLHTVPAMFGSRRVAGFVADLETRLPEIQIETASNPDESAALIGSAEILVAAGLPTELLGDAHALGWVQSVYAGVDRYDLDQLRTMDVVVTTASGVHAEPIAEQILGYLLVFERQLNRAIRQQDRRVWERFAGGELRGKTLGIIGLGQIGSRVAELGAAFGMTVVGTKRDPTTAPDAVTTAYPPDGLYRVLEAADYVVISCPLTPETDGLIGRDELATMDNDAILVNIARGRIVDEDALARTLQWGGLGGAALDVFDDEPLPDTSPFWGLSNVIITPHMSGSTPRYLDRLAELFAHNYHQFTGASGEPGELRNRVA